MPHERTRRRGGNDSDDGPGATLVGWGFQLRGAPALAELVGISGTQVQLLASGGLRVGEGRCFVFSQEGQKRKVIVTLLEIHCSRIALERFLTAANPWNCGIGRGCFSKGRKIHRVIGVRRCVGQNSSSSHQPLSEAGGKATEDLPLGCEKDPLLQLPSCRVVAMPPGKTGEKETLVLQCEWDICSFVASKMEEFCEHVSQHLQQHLQGKEEDNEIDSLEEYACLWQECGFCSPESPSELIRHVYFHCYHTKLKQWGLHALQSQSDLTPCQLDFQSRNIIPEIQENFLCLWEYCERAFDNPEWFYRHVEDHSFCAEYKAIGKENHMVFCGWKECDCTFKGRCKLREHLRSHTQEKVVACPTCGGMFSNNTKFFDHIRRQTALEQQRFQCSHCSKRFATERLLRDHMRNHVNHYKCPLCDMTCPLPSSLRNHIRFRHSEERPYKCNYCDHSCKNLIDLRKHLDTHSKEPAYRCEFEACDFSARSLCSIKLHYKKVHEGDLEPRYKCHVCDKCFTRGNNLTVHLRKKHQFKWPSGHPRFRYKEHEDGYMRLQLVRYESVELTEQLLKDREKQGESLDEAAQCVVLAGSEGGLQGIILDSPTEEPAEADLPAGVPTDSSAPPCAGESPDCDPSAPPSPIIRVVSRTNEQGENETVYYVMANAPSESRAVVPSGLVPEPEENVMDRLQKTAEELGIQIL